MSWSRPQKNHLLISIIGTMAALIGFRMVVNPERLGTFHWLWLPTAIVVVALNLLPAFGLVQPKVRHAALFLVYGAALGTTVAQAMSKPVALQPLDWIWLAVAVIGALVHYSPSADDAYTS
ncbi:MAG: hypothetical protein AAGN66_03410 [Acidobacteriota bacterium]